MSNINIGSIVKLKPEAFTEGQALDDLSGTLGHPGIFKFITFKVMSLQDSSRGKVASCEVASTSACKSVIPNLKEVKVKGQCVLILSELMLTVDKITLDYVILDDAPAKIAALFEERKVLRAEGKAKASPAMMKNWRMIQMLRGERKNDGSVEATAVVKLKNGIRLNVDRKLLPDGSADSEKKFQSYLVGEIQKIRGNRKVIAQDKQSKKSLEILGDKAVKVGGVYQEAGTLLAQYEERVRTMFDEPKRPSDKLANYVGVEIEFIFSSNEKLLKSQLIRRGLHKYVELKDDGSLRACHGAKGYGTKEMTILCKADEIEGVMEKLQEVFNHPLIDAYANRSCGVHVHLDMRNRDVNLAYKNLFRTQNILRGAQPVGRIKSDFCKANTTDDFKKQKEESAGRRYWVINPDSFDRHKTIEIRIHEGSTDCQGLASWVMFLNTIASLSTELPAKEFSKASELVTAGVSIPERSVNYLDMRISKFNSLAI